MKKEQTNMELKDELGFSKKATLLKNLGVGFLACFVLAGLLGVFGFGPWSMVRSGSPSTLSLEYQSMLRATKQTPLTVFVRGHGGEATVFIGRSYFEKVMIREVDPRPVTVSYDSTGFTYYFAAADTGMLHITFYTTPQKAGRVNTIVASGPYRQAIRQFIYP